MLSIMRHSCALNIVISTYVLICICVCLCPIILFASPCLHARLSSLERQELTSGPGSVRKLRLTMLASLGILFHICMFLGGADSAGDQVATAELVAEQLAEDPYAWSVWSFCLLHQTHLVVKRQLTRAVGLFSHCAKMANTWRAPNTAARFFNAWKLLFGDARAKKAAGRLPPNPLSGHSGQIHKTTAPN